MSETPSRLLVEGAAELHIQLSGQQVAQFMGYLHELVLWNERFNLTTITGERDAVVKHLLDSLALLAALDVPYQFVQPAVWKRACRSFSSKRRISPARASGILGFSDLGSGGSSVLCLTATATGEAASNGSLPVAISKSITPRE